MVDNSNWTERMLGFFTVSDNGDISPMMHLCKTDVYNLAIHLSKMYSEIDTIKSQAIDFSISLTPTDGLGISSSDLEQIGAKTYEQVDDILKTLTLEKEDTSHWQDNYELLCEKHSKNIVDNVWIRHKKSQYKRNNLPIRMC
jgi:NH3-dependent NAD+ synthetase